MFIEEVVPQLEKVRAGKRVVLVTGVFDLFHEEHQHFLDKAKAAGDILVVGLESDSRVKQLKGENRPIWNQSKREATVKAYSAVDFVFIMPEEFSKPQDHENLIGAIKPDVLAVSSHTANMDKKKAILEKFGGEVRVVHQFNPEVSTTQLVDPPKDE